MKIIKSLLITSACICISLSSLAQQPFYDVTANNGNGIRFWQNDLWKIHMGHAPEYHYGPVTDYSIKSNMDGTAGRGWTWGSAGQTPVAALSNLGQMQIAGKFIVENGIYFNQSGMASDGYPSARFIEGWGIKFDSPDTRWVFSSKPSVLIGYVPGGQDWGSNNLLVAGKIGVGTSNPVYGRFQVTQESDTPDYGIAILNSTGGRAMRLWTDTNRSYVYSAGSGTAPLILNNGGPVGIGTPNPDQLLTVNGIIHTKEVKIDLSVPGPDYVFEKDYKLPSLEQIKSYIDQNKHLPEVPSAKEMEANGVNVGEMNMLLLKKVEELTLHLIEMKEENETSKQKMQKMQLAIDQLTQKK